MSNLLVQNIKHTNATTAMTVDTSGRVLQPTKPMWFAYFASGSYSFASGETSKVPYTTTLTNVGSCWSTTDRQFTAPIAGTYQINFAMTVAETDASRYVVFRVYKGGSQLGSVHSGHPLPTGSSNQFSHRMSQLILTFSQGETFYVIPQAENTCELYADLGTHCSGFLLG
jgi:hypothetical protein|tara:strand:+ start:1435 stop:1944 length:510 start_codon:yes stop_codon:yes gene_type:complete